MYHNQGQRVRVLGIFSAISITIFVWLARASSPSFYELSIYRGVPVIGWVLLVAAVLVSLGGAHLTSSRRGRLLLALIGALGVFAVVWLPMIRGYYFFDEHDSMTYLGLMRSVVSGEVPLIEMFYPAMAGSAVTIAHFSGQSIRWSLLFTALTVPTISVFLIAVAARWLTNTRGATLAGLSVGLFFAPLNPLNVMLVPHASTQAIFFCAVPLASYLAYMRTGERRWVFPLGIGLMTLYFYHPQQIINFLLFLYVVTLANGYEDSIFDNVKVPNRNPVPLILAASVFTSFAIISHWKFKGGFSWVVLSIVEGIDAGGVSGRAASLSALDVSYPMLALKAGAKELVLGVGVLGAIYYWWAERPSMPIPVPSYIFGIIPIVVTGGMFYIVGGGNQMVRYFGMAAMLAAPLGAVGFACIIEKIDVSSLQVRRVAIVCVLLVGIVAAIPTFHHAPYTERYGPHVPEGQYDSFDTAFEYAGEDVTFLHIRSTGFRYHHAQYGFVPPDTDVSYLPPRKSGKAPPHFRNVEQEYDEPFYLSITRADLRRDTDLYNGFKYSQEDIDRLRNSPQYDRIYNSKHLDLYFNGQENDE